MESKAHKVPTSVRLDADLRRRVEEKLLERKYGESKLTFEAAMHEALEQWLTQGSSLGSQKTLDSSVTPEQNISSLIPQLNSGELASQLASSISGPVLEAVRDGMDAIRRDLDLFFTGLESHEPPNSSRTTSASPEEGPLTAKVARLVGGKTTRGSGREKNTKRIGSGRNR